MTMRPLDWLPAHVQERSRVRELGAGETLFRQGEKASAIFGVEQGRLRLIRHTIDNRPVDELFAEAALFANTYHCNAIAPVASVVRVYPKSALLGLFRADPALAERFTALLAHQVHVLRARLEERNIQSARERVLHHLSLMAGKDGRTMHLDGTVLALAEEIGLSHESLYRTLADLEKAGTIRRTASTIIIRR
jgi:CRP-like cAMP-binding protein